MLNLENHEAKAAGAVVKANFGIAGRRMARYAPEAELTGFEELKALPGVYVVGEMLDWEAPTGGYLLQACFASAVWAATTILG